MPKTLGIIAEYDPFHKGHVFHLAASKRRSGADRVVCVMSGPFMQRGEPSLFDKYVRAEAAIKNGIDLVLELPFVYAATGAENFAKGSVRILSGLSIVDAIAFGSERAAESPDTAALELATIARLLAFETPSFSERTKRYLKSGLSYPAARQAALSDELGNDVAALASQPNDILAVEYLRQLALLDYERTNRSMMCFRPVFYASEAEPVPTPRRPEIYAIPRIGAGPNGINEQYGFAGAGAIRALIRDGKFGRAMAYVPIGTAETIQAAITDAIPSVSRWELRSNPTYETDLMRSPGRGRAMVLPADLIRAIEYSAITLDPTSAKDIYSAAEGLENRILESAGRTEGFAELVRAVKTKRYTETRVLRLLLHTAARLTKADMHAALEERICARVLGFNERGAEMLKEIRASSQEVYVFQNMRLEQDELARSKTQIGLGVRADKLYHMIGRGSLAGYRYSPEPVRVGLAAK